MATLRANILGEEHEPFFCIPVFDNKAYVLAVELVDDWL